MVERTATVRNAHGIHCRPAVEIVKAALACPGEVRVVTGSGQADLHSLLGLMSLGLEKGREVRIRVSGPDEAAVCDMLAKLFEAHFDFPPLSAAERARIAGGICARRRA